jgi:hypothetical protein
MFVGADKKISVSRSSALEEVYGRYSLTRIDEEGFIVIGILLVGRAATVNCALDEVSSLSLDLRTHSILAERTYAIQTCHKQSSA